MQGLHPKAVKSTVGYSKMFNHSIKFYYMHVSSLEEVNLSVLIFTTETHVDPFCVEVVLNEYHIYL